MDTPTDDLMPPLSLLTRNERLGLLMRYGLGSEDATAGMTLVDIAQRLGVSTQRASQLESSALAKMRQALKARGIESVEDLI
jgi:DNA-directed RNA polymerase sigma subunit (sigma70/sigma32)